MDKGFVEEIASEMKKQKIEPTGDIKEKIVQIIGDLSMSNLGT